MIEAIYYTQLAAACAKLGVITQDEELSPGRWHLAVSRDDIANLFGQPNDIADAGWSRFATRLTAETGLRVVPSSKCDEWISLAVFPT